MSSKPKTHVYIDGFNLYYRLRKTPYKWLDVVQAMKLLLPNHDVQKVHYFTARIKPRPDDLTGPSRQGVYLAALAALPEVEIHYGQFRKSNVRMMQVNPPPPPASPFAEVIKYEEKGSDVNIAAWMLVEALEGVCDCSVLVSNDSDLAVAIEMLIARGHNVGLVNPWDTNPNGQLVRQHPTSIHRMRDGLLGSSQLPASITLPTGTVTKPPTW